MQFENFTRARQPGVKGEFWWAWVFVLSKPLWNENHYGMTSKKNMVPEPGK